MPFISQYKIYASVEPCNYTGEKLKEVVGKILDERFSNGKKELNLDGCCIGPNGMTILVKDERLANIKRLNLGGNKIRNEGAVMLAESPLVEKLQWIELGANEIGPKGIEAIITSENLKKVKTLNLYLNHLGDEGTITLAQKNCLTRIEEMDLAQNEIGDEGLRALMSSGKFPNLVGLYIDNNFASQDVKEEAKVSRNFKKLQSLNL